MHYNWHRYYDPRTGRYITPDPAGQQGGINLYLYVENNPINFVDANGLWGFGVIGLASRGGTDCHWGRSDRFIRRWRFRRSLTRSKSWRVRKRGSLCFGTRICGLVSFAMRGNNTRRWCICRRGSCGFLTNATTASELRGPFDTYSFNVGVGPFKVSVQFGTGNGIWIGSATFGPGAGISGSRYPMNTWDNMMTKIILSLTLLILSGSLFQLFGRYLYNYRSRRLN